MTLGHVHLKVRDIGRAVAFYTRYLGLVVTERIGDHYVFLSASARHHDLALQNIGPDARPPERYTTGLYHVAFEVPDKRALVDAYLNLIQDGCEVRAVDHGISWALYFTDPDGNGLEIYYDTRGEVGGTEMWQGRTRPLAEVLLGPQPTLA